MACLLLGLKGWARGAEAAEARSAIGATRIETLLRLQADELLGWALHADDGPRTLQAPDGRPLWGRLAAGRLSANAQAGRPRPAAALPATAPCDALAALESGDATLSAAARRARRVLDKPIALLLQGESGTGKELFAQAVHASGPRARAPFVAVNCAALPDTLIEAELFGYRPGAFTGASRDGAPGRIREDLYYRLNGLTLQLPPLRERSDLAALVQRLLHELRPECATELAPELALAMARYRWPGNLRQLHNALRTACALLEPGEQRITWMHLPDDLAEALRQAPAPRVQPDAQADLRRQAQQAVAQTVQACAGNLSEAARRLGISRNTLYRKLREATPA